MGWPIGHSRSPVLHNFWLEEQGIDGVYVPLAVRPEQLGEALRDRAHVLATGACATADGSVLWQATSEPELTMRRFSDAFLEEYVAGEAESLLGSVGAYRLEGKGVQLFARIAGDYFAVLGIPLLELLDFLRTREVVPK